MATTTKAAAPAKKSGFQGVKLHGSFSLSAVQQVMVYGISLWVTPTTSSVATAADIPQTC